MPNVALVTFLMVFELNQAICHTHYIYACWPRLVRCHIPDERFWESVLESPFNAFTLWLDFKGLSPFERDECNIIEPVEVE